MADLAQYRAPLLDNPVNSATDLLKSKWQDCNHLIDLSFYDQYISIIHMAAIIALRRFLPSLTTKKSLLVRMAQNQARASSTLLVDSGGKYSFLKKLGLKADNDGVFSGKWGGRGEVILCLGCRILHLNVVYVF